MTGQQNNNDEHRISNILNAMIRESRKEIGSLAGRPSDETIQANLLGTATSEQRNEFEKALIKSSVFRSEIFELTEKLEQLKSIESVDQIPETENVPACSDFLASYSNTNSDNNKGAGKFIKFYLPLATAAVLALALMLTQFFETDNNQSVKSPWSNPPEIVQTGMLISNITRGGNSIDAVALFSNQREAALEKFRQTLKFEKGVFVKNDYQNGSDSVDNSDLVIRHLQLFDASGAKVTNVSIRVPKLVNANKQHQTVFILSLPDRKLYETELARVIEGLHWSDTLSNALCITIIYPVQDSFKATDAAYIELPKNR